MNVWRASAAELTTTRADTGGNGANSSNPLPSSDLSGPCEGQICLLGNKDGKWQNIPWHNVVAKMKLRFYFQRNVNEMAITNQFASMRFVQRQDILT
jgi:hypothetical protein